MKCKICNKQTKRIFSFGKMPIANGFLTNVTDHEYLYNLTINFCSFCLMVQIGDTVPATKMFNKNYHFISSTSETMIDHFKKQAKEILNIIKNKNNPLIIELGSNDGIMLKHIARKKYRHLGIEPAQNVASIAIKNGVNTTTEFFNLKTARKIAAEYGKADVICGSNVTCHIEDLNSVARGVYELLKNDGVWFFEDPYIYDIIHKTSFDQIYDEHIYYFSGLSVKNFGELHGFELVDMKPQQFHGGSMRYYLKKKNNNKITKRVKLLLTREIRNHLNKYSGYIQFSRNIKMICHDLKKLVIKLKRNGSSIAGYGATSKSTTLLKLVKISAIHIDYITDNTTTKIDKFTPYTHIPVKSRQYYLQHIPDYMLLLAWNHAKEILNKERQFRNKGGKFITFFPKVKII